MTGLFRQMLAVLGRFLIGKWAGWYQRLKALKEFWEGLPKFQDPPSELDHVKPSLTSLHLGDHALFCAESLGDLLLGDA
jgi:hypothetical protein